MFSYSNTNSRLNRVQAITPMCDELKFCPKCGGEPIIVHGDDDTYQVKCWWDLSCGHHTPRYLTKEQAITEWNTNNPMPNSL